MAEGVTVSVRPPLVIPLVISLVPHAPEYHFHDAAVPSVPSLSVRTTCDSAQTGLVPDIDVGGVDSVPFEPTAKLFVFVAQPPIVTDKL